MRKIKFTLFMLCMFISSIAHAYDFSAVNSDGVTIYYNIIDGGCEVRSGNSDYSGAVNIPSAVTYNSVTYSVTSIGKWAFEGCSSLTSITIPNSVTSIGDSAFDGCSGLTSIVVAQDNEEYDSRDKCNAIIEKRSNTLIAGCKNTVIPNSVTSIGDGAFANCSGLTSITIPNSVGSIGDYAFGDCSGLTSITIPNSVTSIGSSAFWDCSGLTSIVVEEGNNVYDSRENCNAIIEKNSNTLIAGCMNTVIPNSVTSIVDYAFGYCSGLTSITIPNSVTSIGYAFNGCSDLTSIVVEEGNNVYDSRDNCNAIIEKRSNTLIAGCKNTVIPNSVTSIGDDAFEDCSGLTSITIPNSVTSIGSSAFDGCSGLTSITIPNSVTSIGSYAFWGCSGLTSIVVENGNSVYDSRDNCNAIIEKGTNTLIAGCKNTVIPNSVTSIGSSAFWSCSGLTSIKIPNSVTSIGSSAFWSCSGLTSITIPNSVTSIGSSAFDGCSGLTSITIPNSVTSIGSYAFFDCSGLTSITIPNSVTSIGWCAFSGCSGLTSITIPNSVTSIRNQTFQGCSGLTSITIPNSVTSIGDWAFLGCSGLTSITIPNSVTSIGNGAFNGCKSLPIDNGIRYADTYLVEVIDKSKTTYTLKEGTRFIGSYAFSHCSSLTSITIPNSVTSIGFYAFYNSNSLTDVYNCASTPQKIGYNTFTTYNTLHVRKGCKEAYENAGYWKFTIVEDIVGDDILTDVSKYDNIIFINDTKQWPGKQTTMQLMLDNKDEITAMQFDLVLPDGVTIDKNARGNYALAFNAEANRADVTTHTLQSALQEDGSIRVLCYSNTNDIFLDNSGAVLDIPVTIAEDIVPGYYPVLLNNVELTLKNERLRNIAQVVCLLYVPDYEMGDVNKDTEVNVTDIVCTANYILGNAVPVFNTKAADMNYDKKITVTDIVYIANVILGNGNVSKSKGASRAAAGTASLSIAPITMESGASKTVTLDLSNPGRQVTAFQYDMILPKGISIDKNSRGKYNVAFDTKADRADYSSHTLSTEDQTDGSIRFLCYSAGMSTFLGDNGAVVDIPLSASSSMQGGTYDILLENVIITCTDNTEIKYGTLTATITIGDNTATSIDLPSADASSTVYGINGQRRQATSQGINIIRMGNGVVKKVAK